MSLSMRVVEAVVGNVRGRIGVVSRPIEAVEGLKDQAQARAEVQVAKLKDVI